ncbi:thioredoxin-like domain-containing protein [Cokeromyces recurvatus]|uniref:thioredoxin-like domain-containing protein n=1 Tax=Cokeromyces recurvatus TaxID=90255 RepID=UPI0022209B44|nr:thioredoxin-like domain-containing protein [Cokeromyces recurvatus]KAI7905886.1 thioredoxin-like domain-containing protein [Cokeromyces recurvatus]
MRFPTLQANINGKEWKEYTGDFSTKSVEKFIQENQLKRNPTGESVELTKLEELKEIIESKEPWFVKFYAPWCGHYICREFKIAGLPTLNYFIHGASLKFTGERKLEKLMDYAIKMSGSPVLPVETDNELEKILKLHDVNLVYVQSPDDENSQLSLLEQLAPSFMEEIPFYTTHDPKTAHRFNLQKSDLPAAVIVKDGTYQVYSEKSVNNISPWIYQERHPLVTRILPHNSNRILKGDQVVVLGITNPDDTESEIKLRELATMYRDKHGGKDIMFAQLDGKRWGHYVSSAYGIQSNKMPALIVLDPKNDMYYDHDSDKKKFSFSKPETVLASIATLSALKGISTAPSKTMTMIEKIFIFFGDHWIMMTTVLFGLFGVLFWLLTKDEPTPISREQMKEIAKKEIAERKKEKEKDIMIDEKIEKKDDLTSEPKLVERKTMIIDNK